jgi:hypothetical protein
LTFFAVLVPLILSSAGLETFYSQCPVATGTSYSKEELKGSMLTPPSSRIGENKSADDPCAGLPIPTPLLWIDTLCCPAIDGPGKQKAIEKLPLVYRMSRRVLILDSSIFSLDSKDMHVGEIALRMYTSPWMGRLWTLQG